MRILCTGGSGFIGTHLVAALEERGCEAIVNLDIAPPKLEEQQRYWREVDILDSAALTEALRSFRPTHVIHLAARTDMEGETRKDYRVNEEGTSNLISAVKSCRGVERLVVASTQHVRAPGSGPALSDVDFVPYRAYGQSKVETERLTREGGLQCHWTIVRPTTIWGPLHTGMARGIWRSLSRRIYLHPRPDPVVRSYGYVKNVAHQLLTILSLPAELVHEKVMYVGDPCTRQFEWVSAFSMALSGHSVRTAPRVVLLLIALAGEVARRFDLPAPLFISRYRNMVTTNPVPIEQDAALLGTPYSFEDGVAETVAWFRSSRDARR